MLMSKAAAWHDAVNPQTESSPRRSKPTAEPLSGLHFSLLVELSMRSNGFPAQPAMDVAGSKRRTVDGVNLAGAALHDKNPGRVAHPMRTVLADQVERQGATLSAMAGGQFRQELKQSVGTHSAVQGDGAAQGQPASESRAQDAVVRSAVRELPENAADVRANSVQSALLRTLNGSHVPPSADENTQALSKPPLGNGEMGLHAHGGPHSPLVGDSADERLRPVSRPVETEDDFSSSLSTAGHIQAGMTHLPESLGQLQAQQTSPTTSAWAGAGEPVVHLDHAHAPTELGQLVLQQVKAGPSEMRVKVHPEGMGDIVVAVVRHGDSLHLRLEANQAQTVHWLAQHAEALAQAARTNGVDLASVEVVFGQAQLSQGFQEDSSSRRQREWTSRRDAAWMQSSRTDTGVRIVALDLGESGGRVNLQV